MYVVRMCVTDPGPEESADEDEEDSIWRDLRDRSLADAKKSRPLNPSSKMEVADEAERRTVKLIA